MKLVSMFAVAVSLSVGGGLAAPAAAQQAQAQAQAEPTAPARQYKLSGKGRKALAPVEAAVKAKDAAAFAAALPAAQAAVETPDDHYVLAQLQLQHAIDANDKAAQLAAMEAIAQSGGATPQELPNVYRTIGAVHYEAKNLDQAVAAFEKVVQLQPSDAETLIRLAELRNQQKRPADAVAFIEKAIAASKAAGQTVPENWYRRALKFAYEGKLPRETENVSRSLIEAYPTGTNWRDALSIFQTGTSLDDEGELDLLRLMRATKSMTSANDYLVLADRLSRGNYYGEVQDVAREATAAGKSDASISKFAQSAAGKAAEDKAALAGLEAKARADASGQTAMRIANGFFGHGDYAKAADLYKLAAQKGSVDVDLAKTRLGIALAMQGDRAGADAAFKSVGGNRAGLAGLWSLWLAKRG